MNTNSKYIKIIMGLVQHYNDDKYWKMREVVINPNNKNIFLKLYYLFKVKRSDAFNNASMGTNLNYGAIFESRPNLPHHLNGIIISPRAKIGKNCTIYQQVTIGQNEFGDAPTVGNNVTIGAGAKIIGKVKIGNNVKIGANAVVVKDIPDNSTAVGVPARIIDKSK